MATEVEKKNEAQLEAAMAAILDGAPLPYATDPEAVSRGILERILQAETFEEIFKPQGLEAWREHEGRPAEVKRFHLNPTSFETEGEGPSSSVYAVVDLVWLDDGEAATVTCGGRNVMTQLVQALRKGLIPGAKVKIASSRTGEGYTVLWLEAA